MRRYFFLACVAGAVFSSFTAAKVSAQDAVMLDTSALLSTVNKLVSANKWDEALPYLDEIINRFSRSIDKNDSAKKAVGFATFYKGVALIEIEAYPAAIEILNKYKETFPQGGFIANADILIAEAHAHQGEWDLVIPLCKEIVKEISYKIQIRIGAHELLGYAFFEEDRWSEAAQAYNFIWNKSGDQELKLEAAVKILTSLIREDRFDDFFDFLPQAMNTPARYDTGLNLALIEGADVKFTEKEYYKALLLYRIVLGKEAILEHVNQKIITAENALKDLKSFSGLQASRVAAKKRFYGQVYKSSKSQFQELVDFPDYDQELGFRIGLAYFELKRYWESIYSFHKVFDRWPDHDLAERSLYFAFAAAFEKRLDERAFYEARTYMDTYPDGEYYDLISVYAVQLQIERKEWAEGITLGLEALTTHPEHVYQGTLRFLMGYAQFQDNLPEDALVNFKWVMDNEAADGLYTEPAWYWFAMCNLFIPDFAGAQKAFQDFIDQWSNPDYMEDSCYRIGVAAYGTGNYPASLDLHQKFIERFPESEMVSDSLSMIADIHGVNGDLGKAEEYYFKAIDAGKSMVQVNFAAFALGRLYETKNDFQKIIDLFQKYLADHGDKANYTEAAYWIGTAQTRLLRIPDAHNTFLSTIVKHGNVTTNYGTDMILRDLSDEVSAGDTVLATDEFLTRLRRELEEAYRKNQATLRLRLVALFANVNPLQRSDLIKSMFSEHFIPIAGPYTLLLMAEEALRVENHEFALKVCDYYVAQHSTCDLILDILHIQAKTLLKLDRKDEAIIALQGLTDRFASFDQAGWAQIRLGDISFEREDFLTAQSAYERVLSNKSWRGELWAESLYKIGEAKKAMQDVDTSYAYFQRVYVMYETYSEWAAKAYLESGRYHESKGEKEQAVKTYKEMLSKSKLLATPAGTSARKALNAMGETI